MKRIVYLTEVDLYRITKKVIKENELKEGIFNGITNVFQGLKGVWRGEGYDFFRYMSQLKNTVGDLKKHSKAIDRLRNIKTKVANSKMPPEKKGELIKEIDKLVMSFDRYSEELNQVERNVKNRLAGNTSYAPYMNTSKDDNKRKLHNKTKKDSESSMDELNPEETKDLGQYGYDDDYNEINQKIKNKVSVGIGGKPMDIEDKSMDNPNVVVRTTDPINKKNSFKPAGAPSNDSNRARKTDGFDPNKLPEPPSNVSERRYRRY